MTLICLFESFQGAARKRYSLLLNQITAIFQPPDNVTVFAELTFPHESNRLILLNIFGSATEPQFVLLD